MNADLGFFPANDSIPYNSGTSSTSKKLVVIGHSVQIVIDLYRLARQGRPYQYLMLNKRILINHPPVRSPKVEAGQTHMR